MERVDEEAPKTEEIILTTNPSQDFNTSVQYSRQKGVSIDITNATASGTPSARAFNRDRAGGLIPANSAKGLVPVNSLNNSVLTSSNHQLNTS